MKDIVNHDGEISEPFAIESGVKQGCVLAPPLSAFLLYALCFQTLHIGPIVTPGRLFNLSRLGAKTKPPVLIREMLSADDTAL